MDTSRPLFCLFFQVFVVAATVVNWDFSRMLQGPEAAWIGDYFYLNWAVRSNDGATSRRGSAPCSGRRTGGRRFRRRPR